MPVLEFKCRFWAVKCRFQALSAGFGEKIKKNNKKIKRLKDVCINTRPPPESFMGQAVTGTNYFAWFPGNDMNQGGENSNSRPRQSEEIFGSARTDPVQFKWGFGEGLLKDKFAFFEASKKKPIPKRRNLLAKRPFL